MITDGRGHAKLFKRCAKWAENPTDISALCMICPKMQTRHGYDLMAKILPLQLSVGIAINISCSVHGSTFWYKFIFNLLPWISSVVNSYTQSRNVTNSAQHQEASVLGIWTFINCEPCEWPAYLESVFFCQLLGELIFTLVVFLCEYFQLCLCLNGSVLHSQTIWWVCLKTKTSTCCSRVLYQQCHVPLVP